MPGSTTVKWRCGAVVITTAQLHSTKPELRFCTGSNPARGVSEIRDGEDLWQWSRLEIRLNAFCRSTIPQKQFIIIIIKTSPKLKFILPFVFYEINIDSINIPWISFADISRNNARITEKYKCLPDVLQMQMVFRGRLVGLELWPWILEEPFFR